MPDEAQVWVLLGGKVGDNRQLLRLAEEIGLPFRTIQLKYNPLHLIPPLMLGASMASLDARSRREIRPPWPRLVLGIGYRSVPVALAIRDLSGGATKLVRLGNPRLDPGRFDLVITTAQYSVPEAANVLRLPVGLSTVPDVEPTDEERDWLDKLPRPRRLFLIGGDTFMWELNPGKLTTAAINIGWKEGGSAIAVSSARSRKPALGAVSHALQGHKHALVWGKFPRYAVLLRDADEIYVTADSVSMISDAVATRRPVGLVLPERSPIGRLLYGAAGLVGGRVPIRDVQAFWKGVLARGLAGTIERPVVGKAELDSLQAAVAAVRKLL
jgi:mitochondrial fission protein ELM1